VKQNFTVGQGVLDCVEAFALHRSFAELSRNSG
jgi:hypothetical protein